LDNIIGPNGEVWLPVGYQIGFSPFTSENIGALYACDVYDFQRVGGRVAEYLAEMANIVLRDSQAAGF